MRRARAFTLVELTVALALMAVLLGLVIVRFSWDSPRQHVIAEARRFGNFVETFRERALSEERLFALAVDLNEGTVVIASPQERSVAALAYAPVLRSLTLNAPVRFKSAFLKEKTFTSPVILYLDPKGILPPMQWIMEHPHGESVSVKFDPLQSEVTYEEP